MKMKPAVQGVGLLILATILSHPFTLNAARTSPLRYDPSEDQTNVYKVRIEAEGENGKEILAGNIILVPKAGPSNLVTVTIRGSLVPSREGVSRMAMPPYPMGPYATPRWSSPIYLNEGCELLIDEHGEILRSGGDYPLTVPLGSIAQLIVQTLPAGKETRWESTETLGVLDEPLNIGPARAFSGSPYGFPIYGGLNPRNRIAVLGAVRTTKFLVETSSPDAITIKESSVIKSELRNGASPRTEGMVDRTAIVDRKSGFLRQADIQFKSVINTEVVTRRTTGTVQVKLLEGQERTDALNSAVPRVASTETLSAAALDKVLQSARSNDINLQHEAAGQLQSATLTNVPPGLIEIATNWISSDDYQLKMTGARIVADFGTEEVVPLLLKLLKLNESVTLSSVINGLGRLKDPRAAQPLADVVARGWNGYNAAEALGKLGPSAEDVVLTLLNQKHLETLRSACNILKQIGTKKSIEPLRELMLDPDPQLSSAAAEAIRAIQARE